MNVSLKKQKNGKRIGILGRIRIYFENEANSNNEKIIFIAIDERGMIYIFSIFMKNKQLTTSKKKEGIFEIIKTEKLNLIKPLRISKLRNLFKIKQNDNYFIINSMSSSENGKAIIINVKENNDTIKERYTLRLFKK